CAQGGTGRYYYAMDYW
nr:immunoglobulin heavy chain junction region [Mus musculus]